MTDTQKRFEDNKAEYEAEYLRTNGKPVDICYVNGKILVNRTPAFKSVSHFEMALKTLKDRKDFQF